MIPNELEHSIEKFDIQRQRDAAHFQRLENLQQTFVNDFPVETVKELNLDEYIEGKGSHTSFCYRLERQLDEIGNMRGSTSAVFVVYYGRKGKGSEQKYRFTNKLGQVQNEQEALALVKEEIIKLIKAGKSRDYKAILTNRLADLFKYKILGTYFPDEYLNLYSHRHLNYFIGELGLNPKGKTVLDKQNILLAFKNSNELTNTWSNFEFNSFLYTTFARPPANDEEEKQKDALPAIEKIKPELVDFEITQATRKTSNNGKGSPKPDYEANQERNNKLGRRGEIIVLRWEEAFLKKNKLSLAHLDHVSEKDDRLGYDIKSLDENGKVKYIEVKATRRKKGDVNFIITDNEKQKAENLENYYIYVVFEAHTLNPKIWPIKEPFKVHQEKFNLSPINYRVEISVKE